MKAVHFGAGNIGRGFVGLILHNAGYEVVFADVNAELIDALAETPSYQVHEVGASSKSWTVDNYRALNSATHEADVVAEIASADIVTTAVGPNILRFVAPLIARAINEREGASKPLAVMACENAINATDLLKQEIVAGLDDAALAALDERAVFANTAVDRIVPGQAADAGLDVTVEDFFEWAIESGPFGDDLPKIPEAHFVDDLAPYIERKLFTVNTGHATTAYFGFLEGAGTLSDAMRSPEVFARVAAVLDETKTLLIAKYDFDPEVQETYVQKNLTRFANPFLPDTPARVGRQPVRKLGRHERFIGPAAELAERGLVPEALLGAIGAALRFDLPEDAQSVELRELLATASAADVTSRLTGLDASHPLYAHVVRVVERVQKS
ncbi:mannitol-1-phosphate 5-dehydrogenase [Agreia sp. VKM Ac-1783]|uniref:mannitol-1-phosphate 5-dehydrogenase n=1 Tax=Agreia sp. VKM Ac-1783 TaxID=1938889 RepID=UPI000A2AE2B6|nr:mannitol-1-phosphate 5-dehydrogenase [Agreia sp. VKM Ac-1783]SMQ71735.1 D-mannitol 1-phosphate 5-dehydrogenase [Agreia sp. VKM Ac-1783]